MKNEQLLSGLSGLLTMHAACSRAGRSAGLSSHLVRLLLAIYSLQMIDLTRVTRHKVSRRTYFWYHVVCSGVSKLIEKGYIEPLKAPRNYLTFTPQGLGIVSDIEKAYNRQMKILAEGPPIINRPRTSNKDKANRKTE